MVRRNGHRPAPHGSEKGERSPWANLTGTPALVATGRSARRSEGHEIRDEDVARLSPLRHKNLNVLGRYSFTASQPFDGLRPLRDPDAADLDDDDDGNDE
jgi:hypothetical protein